MNVVLAEGSNHAQSARP